MKYTDEYEKAKKQKETKDLTPEYLTWGKKGDTIVGCFKGRSLVSGKLSSEYHQYIFDTDKGLVKFHMGAASDADVGAALEVGSCYAITFQGQLELEGGRRVNKFKVEAFSVGASEPVGGEDDVPF